MAIPNNRDITRLAIILALSKELPQSPDESIEGTAKKARLIYRHIARTTRILNANSTNSDQSFSLLDFEFMFQTAEHSAAHQLGVKYFNARWRPNAVEIIRFIRNCRAARRFFITRLNCPQKQTAAIYFSQTSEVD